MPCAVVQFRRPSEGWARRVARQPHATEEEASLRKWEEAQRLQGIGGSGQSETGIAPGRGGEAGGRTHGRREGILPGAHTQLAQRGVSWEGECCWEWAYEEDYRSQRVGQETAEGYPEPDANMLLHPFLLFAGNRAGLHRNCWPEI